MATTAHWSDNGGSVGKAPFVPDDSDNNNSIEKGNNWVNPEPEISREVQLAKAKEYLERARNACIIDTAYCPHCKEWWTEEITREEELVGRDVHPCCKQKYVPPSR